MNAKLHVVVGNTTKREVSLRLPTVLGRSREADITVAHPLISRRHCEISEDNGMLILRDLKSLNGTMIGGRRVEFAPLPPDAEFTIGPITFRVRYEFDGDMALIPETRFLDGGDEQAVAGLDEAIPAEAGDVPMREAEEAVPADSSSGGLSGEFPMPDLMALADADPDEILPPLPMHPAAAQAAAPGATAPPPVADHAPQPPGPLADALAEPAEVDSSLQSGGLAKDSAWAAEPHVPTPPRQVPTASSTKAEPGQPERPPEATTAKKGDKSPPKPQRGPGQGDDMDPEFGSFLEGLG